MTQRRLTDRTLKALKPSSPGKRYELMDVETRGLGVRVNDKGRKVFILIARYPGKKHLVRRTLGEYDAMTLADAREEVRNWRKMMGNGIDPRVEKERRKHAEARRQENSFASVAEAYFTYIKRQKLRRAGEVERDTGTQRGGSPPKTIVDDGDWHTVFFTILESDSDAKIYWKSKDGDQTTIIHGPSVKAFQTAGQFKVEALGNENHSFKYGYVLFRLKNSKGEKT